MMHSEFINRTNILDTYDILKTKQKVVIQIAGSDPLSLAKASKLIEKKGFKEVNLNCGCPSPRVQSGKFGITLLTKPLLVSQCVSKIKEKTNLKLSIKTRIGIDSYDDDLLDLFLVELNKVKQEKYIIHARKAILKNISAKKNLNIPKLDYARVLKIKNKFKNKEIIINGGFSKTDYDNNFIKQVDGIMIGRSAYKNPWIFSKNKNLNLQEKINITEVYISFISYYFKNYKFIPSAIMHLHNVFNGHPGSKVWKQLLSNSLKNKNISCLFDYLKYNKS